ncbi:SDR family NAD(P)-dependent oxidoreductase [Cryobacterium sp. SO2]|uniref:SDR family NAD(P)-dependent oxidoreductase n=1 Tax=Cryobacterium sp. SO2 TaxID=1897060 RepID=UPI00223E3764|nr:SDR family oxidoreductase [Cryobacterium sp. SO2]WEO77828.1 SDR family NAD(P)-dependent oxidoreductase [Cryobacterium sp. SO2]
MNALARQRIVVTGGARGLGEAMAVALAQAGAFVIVADIDPTALAGMLDRHPNERALLHPKVLDITDEDAVAAFAESLFTEHGGVDAVFANAGIVLVRPSAELRNADLQRVFDINVLGTFATAREFGVRMLAQGHGKIIITASQAGTSGAAEWTAYCASKAAAISITQSLASEWGPTLTVNAIAPGAVRTNINAHVMNDEAAAAIAAGTPAGRLAEPEDFGPLAVFLAGPGADMMSGAVVVMDGGAR